MTFRNYPEKLIIAADQNKKEKSYWLNQLSGGPGKTVFPCNFENTGLSEYHMDSMSFALPGDLASKLVQITKMSDRALNLVLTSGVILLLNKYTGGKDITTGTTVYRQEMEGDFINTILVLRNRIEDNITFKEWIPRVRQTILDAVKHQNYPIELLNEKLNMDGALFDVAVLLENIHERKYLRNIQCSMIFSFKRDAERIHGTVEYNSALYENAYVENVIAHFKQLLYNALFNTHLLLPDIDILTGEEKKRLLEDFNNTAAGYPGGKTIHRWFEEQVEKTPDRIAVCFPRDLSDIYELLESPPDRPGPVEKMGSCRFKRNTYVYQAPFKLPTANFTPVLLKTHRHNSVIVNNNVVELLKQFDGNIDLKSIYSRVKEIENENGEHFEFFIYAMDSTDLLEATFQFTQPSETFSIKRFEDIVELVRSLYGNHLIELAGISPEEPGTLYSKELNVEGFSEEKGLVEVNDLEHVLIKSRELEKVQVLLLGDTPGTPTTGLLYLGAYLRRNGITAHCRFYDPARDYPAMKKNIEALLEETQPRIAAVSMKWFLHIARVIDMCKIIKEYAGKNSLEIKVVLGGNTASYYPEKVIEYDCIDYLVRGDGEVPLLKICRGEDESVIPNLFYKKDGKIMENPVTYIQDESNSPGIYLSHLDELLISDFASLFGTFFIYTHKGCAMNCLYCGGCSQAQRKTFNRKTVFRRGIGEVRKDILEAKKYASTFQFEFDILDDNLPAYCRNIWEGIDLSGHFCIFSTLTPPSPALVQLLSRTFKYVYWDFDICTLSERHRKQLFSLGSVKPQPTDEDIFNFMAQCELHPNIEVRLNLITGLPHFTVEDIEPGEKLLSRIMNTYSCFGELHWARLHAQPGAPIVQDAAKHQMHSYASSFEDFLEHGKEDFRQKSGYSTVENFNYPYIYFNDDRLNSRVTALYLEIDKNVSRHRDDRRRDLMVHSTLTYRQLNEKADLLSGALWAMGVKPGGIVGLMLERSPDIPVGILGTLKAGCAYIPIDPEFPSERIKYMLDDSKAGVLVTTPKLRVKVQAGEKFVETIDISDLSSFSTSTHRVGFAGLAYVIYTSGTTGKSKGTLLTHQNLVNYVHWFSTAGNLTAGDKTVLTSSFAFDLGYTSLFTSLLNGGELHILPRDIYLLAERFLNYIKRQCITYIKVTPSLFSILVNASNFSAETCRSLRLAAIGGEAIKVEDIEKAHSICSHLQIMNHYGPTEATIGCVATFIDFDEFEAYRKHPVIGKPIHNTGAYILSRDLNLLPAGVPGELCISGAGLARGYLNRPELSADKFYRSYKSYTLYRTGDRARWLPDGNIEFLGRIDKQVKIRGYRIELGEIEERLSKHEQVKEALVVVKEEPEGDTGKGIDNKYLCAYFVPMGSINKSEKKPAIDEKTLSLKEIAGGESAAALAGDYPGFEKGDAFQSIAHCFRDLVKKNPDKIAVQSNGRTLTYESLDKYAGRVARKILEEYEDRDKLSKSERTRYKRQMLLYGWGQGAQEKLKGAVVFVAGAGGGASPTIVQLALAGVGTIKVCDFDSVELSNLNRQFLHDDERLGMNKARSAQVTVSKINPHVKMIPYTQKLTAENISEIVGDVDIIFDMFDSPDDKFVLSRYAVEKGIPHVIISMTDINAYAGIFHTPHTPCYHCIFDRQKLETIVTGMRNYVENYSKNPLPVLAASLFTCTGTAVTEALKILLDFKEPAYNKFFYFNHRGVEENLVYTPGYRAMTHLFSDHFLRLCKEQGFDWDVGWRGNFLEELKIEPDPNCPVCGAKIENRKEQEASEQQMKPPTNVSREALQTISLLFDRDIPMAAGVLGALEAGKTYVPLDTAASMESLVYSLEDSESRIILTENDHIRLAEKLRDKVNKNIKVINIENIDELPEAHEDRSIEIDPDQPAYMLYAPESTVNHEAGRCVVESHGDALDFVKRYKKSFSHNGLRLTLMDFLGALLNGNAPYIFEGRKQAPIPGSLSSELRVYLSEGLPGYMVPAYFVPLERLPLTPNGKIDKNALPEPGLGPGEKVAAPGNDVEKKLLEIWCALLEKEKDTIGIDSNFFELGGHSLNATIMAARVNKELNVKLPVGEVFKTPTIKELSRYLMGAEENIHNSIQPVEKKEYYPLSSAQMRMFLLSRIKTTTSDNIPGVFQAEGPLDVQHLEDSINLIIKRHELLRTSFEMAEHQPVQRVHDHVAFEITHMEASCGAHSISDRQIKDIIDGFVRPFDLSKAPLLRVGLLKLEEEKHLLIYDMHHIISDGTSFQLFIREFLSLFAVTELPPMNIQYKDFAVWQNSLKESGVLKKQEEYWLNLFSGDIPTLNLSTDFPRQAVQSFEGDTIIFVLDNDLTAGINESASQVGATLYMALLAIYNILLYKLTGQEDIVVGSSSAGRPHTDLEQVIGFFVNTLAMRNYPRGEKTYMDFLESVKTNALKAYDNQEYQFDELVNRLGIQRDAGRQVLFDTHFTLHNIYVESSTVSNRGPGPGNLRFSSYPMEVDTTQFDIIIHANETSGGVYFTLRYCSKLFKRETMERFTKHYEDITRIVAENKNIKLKDIKISHRLETAQTNMPEVNFNF